SLKAVTRCRGPRSTVARDRAGPRRLQAAVRPGMRSAAAGWERRGTACGSSLNLEEESERQREPETLVAGRMVGVARDRGPRADLDAQRLGDAALQSECTDGREAAVLQVDAAGRVVLLPAGEQFDGDAPLGSLDRGVEAIRRQPI